MKHILLGLLLTTATIANSQFCFFPDETETLFSRSMQLIKPAHVNWVRSTSLKVFTGQLNPSLVNTEASRYAVLGNLSNSDIEALVFLVLMQAAKSAQEDLRDILNDLKELNQKKAKQREAMNLLKSGKSGIKYNTQLDSLKRAIGLFKAPNVPIRVTAVAVREVTKKDIDATVDSIKNDLDSMSELGEMESNRLQGAMDRMSQLMSTLSNMLKKITGTAETMTQNLK